MIEKEVLAITNSASDAAAALNALVDQFRLGRDPEELLRLLFSEDDELIRIGVWITAEISTEHYNTVPFISCLKELTNHQDPSVRLYALSALFPLLDPTNRETHEIIIKLMKDSNDGVRETADVAAKTLGIV